MDDKEYQLLVRSLSKELGDEMNDVEKGLKKMVKRRFWFHSFAILILSSAFFVLLVMYFILYGMVRSL